MQVIFTLIFQTSRNFLVAAMIDGEAVADIDTWYPAKPEQRRRSRAGEGGTRAAANLPGSRRWNSAYFASLPKTRDCSAVERRFLRSYNEFERNSGLWCPNWFWRLQNVTSRDYSGDHGVCMCAGSLQRGHYGQHRFFYDGAHDDCA